MAWGKNCLDDICQRVEECVGRKLMEVSCQIEEVAEGVESEAQRRNFDLVWS